MNSQRVFSLVKKDLKKVVREPATLFMLLLFPVVFTLLFGTSFGAIGGTQSPTYQIGIVNLDAGEFPYWVNNFIGNLSGTDILHIQEFASNQTAQDELIQGNIQAVLIIPENFGESSNAYWDSPNNPNLWVYTSVPLYLDSGSMFATQAIPPIIQQILATTVYKTQSITTPNPIQIGTPSLVESSTLTQFDYFAPGLFAFAAIFITMMVAQSFAEDREKGLLRRINITPTTPTEFMTGQTISNMVVALVQVALVFMMAFLVGYRPLGGLVSLIMAFILVAIFSLTAVGFGLITATIAKSPGAATGIAFIFIMPQMFLGTFMTSTLSASAQAVGQFMPSYYVTDALTSLFLRGAPISSPTIRFLSAFLTIYYPPDINLQNF